ncbi:predicted protein [Botrytis cinerea T4]|uniref:Uncharacterized protein n=1 Tax=Botryotinia fuckeliana (strain T4) TaxID=999810 RepID=G2YHX9_BOTF4|nr:predicted protein [Botrytis cinerea T4]
MAMILLLDAMREQTRDDGNVFGNSKCGLGRMSTARRPARIITVIQRYMHSSPITHLQHITQFPKE